MAKRTRTKSSGRTRQIKKPVAPFEATASVRRPSKPPLVEPFHVTVDQQLKSGHDSYEAAEKTALAIKKRHPQLYVTVYDTKEKRATVIEQPKLASASNTNRLTERATPNAPGRRHTPVAGFKH